MTIQVGVVGAGAHSTRQHGPALARCVAEADDAAAPEITLAAVCDLDAERAAEYAARFGFASTYTDVDHFYDEENLDAVLVISPTDATRELAGDALARGIPTLIEKPPGRSIEETRDLRAIAAEHDTPHQVSFNRRFNPAVERAREFLDGRAPPREVAARLHRVDRLEDHHVFNTGSHAIDLALSFLPAPERVQSHRWRSQSGGESCAALIECADGDAATISLAPDSGAHEETYELVGSEYTLRIDAAEPRVTGFVGGEQRMAWSIEAETAVFERVGALAETRAFLRAVGGERTFAPTLKEGLATVRVAKAIERGGQHEC